jgi:hypothetical protein
MKRKVTAVMLLVSMLMLAACGTIVGTAAGAGIGSISGNTRTGALIGGGAGLMYDILE